MTLNRGKDDKYYYAIPGFYMSAPIVDEIVSTKITDPNMRSENHVNYSGLQKPDLGFFLDASDKTREQRLQLKEKRSDWENREFQTIFNQKLRELAQRGNWIFVDTDKMNITEVLQFVSNKILQHQR